VAKRIKVNRRQFIAGAGAASLSLVGGLPSFAKARQRQKKAASPNQHGTNLGSSIYHQSGIPLGGIGAGSIEIRPDGYLHDWLIFNLGDWAPDQPILEQGYVPNMGPGALSFLLRCKQEGKEPQVRRLGMREDQNDLYSLGWVKSVEAIAYDGQFPKATLHYQDSSLPVKVQGEWFGPFIPHDHQTSGTPGFHAVFTLSNESDRSVEVSLTGALQNPIAGGNADRKLVNSVDRIGEATAIPCGQKQTGRGRARLVA
jgi:uncharacterized protein (DUF608 family)